MIIVIYQNLMKLMILDFIKLIQKDTIILVLLFILKMKILCLQVIFYLKIILVELI